MNDTQPIDTAPRDGTVILTDDGFVRFINQKQWGSPVPNGKWVACDPSGYIFECADNGWFICEPKVWQPVPNWLKLGVNCNGQ